jgi:hypothetical protein
MLATSLTSLVLLLAHLSGSSAKHVGFGSSHDNLLLHRALRRSVEASPSAAAPQVSASAGAKTVVIDDNWDGDVDLSGPPPPGLVESESDLQADEEWCESTKVKRTLKRIHRLIDDVLVLLVGFWYHCHLYIWHRHGRAMCARVSPRLAYNKSKRRVAQTLHRYECRRYRSSP